MNKNDAFYPYEQIKQQLAQIATSLGLTLDTLAFVVEDDPEMSVFQCQFTIRPEAVMSDAEREQAAFDAEFARIEEDEREKELHDKKIPMMEKDINEWLKEGDA